MKPYRVTQSTLICTTLLVVANFSNLSAIDLMEDLYLVGGVSAFSQDAEVRHGGGMGYGIGLDLQLTDTFGLELLWDYAPEIHPATLNEYLVTTPIDPNERRIYDVEAESNIYVSLFGVATLDVNEHISILGKVEVARYWRLETIHYDLIPELGEATRQETAIHEQGYSPAVSVGIRLNLPRFESTSIDLTITGFFDDSVKSSFFGAKIRIPFPRG